MNQIRVGVLVNGSYCAAWKTKVIEEVAAEPGLSLVVVGVLPEGDAKVTESQRPFLFRLFERIDRRLNPTSMAAFQNVAMPFPAAEVRELKISGERDSIEAETSVLADLHVDVLINLVDQPLHPELRAALAQTTRTGLWRLAVGGQNCAAAVYHEHTRGRAVVTVDLNVTPAAATTEQTVDQTYCTPDAMSFARSRAVACVTGSRLFVRALRRLRDTGSVTVEGRPAIGTSGPAEGRTSRVRETLALLPFFARLALSAGRKATRFYQWRTAVGVRMPGLSVIETFERTAFREIHHPLDRFYADPFLFERDGSTFLFVEILYYATRRGVIAVSRLDDAGNPGPFVTVLESDFHLSYPFVFEDGGEIFMLPEQARSGTVQLYRCLEFPTRWVKDAVLLDMPGLDSTCFKHDGRWWLMTALAGDTKLPAQPELHLYHADDVRGPWHAHPKNPIVSDVRKARPAGRVFSEGAALLRPAQDCSILYGRAISWHRIDTLTTTEYLEVEVGRRSGDDCAWIQGAVGTHTYDQTERFCATDALVRPMRAARWLSGRLPN